MAKTVTVREPRTRTLLRGKLRAGGPVRDICIRDISSRGMLIHDSNPPRRGTYVEISNANQCLVVGRVVWSKDDRFGIVTSDPLNVQAIIRQAASKDDMVNDQAFAAHQHKRHAERICGSGERSRQLGGMLQFGTFVALFVAAALFIANTLYGFLAGTFGALPVG